FSWLRSVRSRPALADPVREVDRLTEQVVELRDRARRSLTISLDRSADGLGHTRARLHALPPATTLARGYAIVQRGNGSVVRPATDLQEGEELRVRLTEDSLRASVTEIEAGEDEDSAPAGTDSTGSGTAPAETSEGKNQ